MNDIDMPDIMVKFDRASVQNILKPGVQTIMITGNVSGFPFWGTDMITAIETIKPQ